MYRSKQVLSQFSIYALILCLIVSNGWAGYKRINEPNPADPMAVKIYQLDNGLTVYPREGEGHDIKFRREIKTVKTQDNARPSSQHDPVRRNGTLTIWTHAF